MCCSLFHWADFAEGILKLTIQWKKRVSEGRYRTILKLATPLGNQYLRQRWRLLTPLSEYSSAFNVVKCWTDFPNVLNFLLKLAGLTALVCRVYVCLCHLYWLCDFSMWTHSDFTLVAFHKKEKDFLLFMLCSTCTSFRPLFRNSLVRTRASSAPGVSNTSSVSSVDCSLSDNLETCSRHIFSNGKNIFHLLCQARLCFGSKCVQCCWCHSLPNILYFCASYLVKPSISGWVPKAKPGSFVPLWSLPANTRSCICQHSTGTRANARYEKIHGCIVVQNLQAEAASVWWGYFQLVKAVLPYATTCGRLPLSHSSLRRRCTFLSEGNGFEVLYFRTNKTREWRSENWARS